MRNILKRFTAALLLVCLLATFIVPVNFTVTAEGTQEVIAEYSIPCMMQLQTRATTAGLIGLRQFLP